MCIHTIMTWPLLYVLNGSTVYTSACTERNTLTHAHRNVAIVNLSCIFHEKTNNQKIIMVQHTDVYIYLVSICVAIIAARKNSLYFPYISNGNSQKSRFFSPPKIDHLAA